jgi:transposase
MGIRRKLNSSGSWSVCVYKKSHGKQQHVKSFGSSKNEEELQKLEAEAAIYQEKICEQRSFDFSNSIQTKLSPSELKELVKKLPSFNVRLVGPELILGKLFDEIGFNAISEPLFRDLVICRLVYPTSKLKTTRYLYDTKRQEISIERVYRFLDRFWNKYKEEVETISYRHTQLRVGKISVVFYDMTTLYFEAEDEDDLRRLGYSKDGKFQCPQIMIGLLVSEQGYPIGYDVYAGNTSEGKTLLESLKRQQAKYKLDNPMVIADSDLLSNANIEELNQEGYEYILGARFKNVSGEQKARILDLARGIRDGEYFEISEVVKQRGEEVIEQKRLIISYSSKRAHRDDLNRQRGIKRLESKFGKTKRLTKADINNRGYNKFLKVTPSASELIVEIDQDKIEQDKCWDGLKGYVTNSKMSAKEIISNYGHLWQIEKAFRISKTDLRIRPIYHRKERRIKAHICIAFVAYAVFKELEYRLREYKLDISLYRVLELLQSIFQIEFNGSDEVKVRKFSELSPEQKLVLNNFLPDLDL